MKNKHIPLAMRLLTLLAVAFLLGRPSFARDYVITSGDGLSVKVVGESDYTKSYTVNDDGKIFVPNIGDMVVGKHIGKMMGALGGRIGAYREGLKAGEFEAALVRNLYRGSEPPAAALEHTAERLRAFYLGLHAEPVESIVAGTLP